VRWQRQHPYRESGGGCSDEDLGEGFQADSLHAAQQTATPVTVIQYGIQIAALFSVARRRYYQCVISKGNRWREMSGGLRQGLAVRAEERPEEPAVSFEASETSSHIGR